jgi:FtsP/CotA-like multicopper oxidase with cupredoxin domain
MKMEERRFRNSVVICLVLFGFVAWGVPGAIAQALPGGTLDPTTIPKYVTPLVIPPVMDNTGTPHDYDIAVRQFKQQILPGGIWNTINGRADAFPPTTVWSYGPDEDPLPDSTGLGGGVGIAPAANSQFNYPAYTVENIKDTPTSVDWINDLKENFGAGPKYLKHLLPIDQTLHWANPTADCIEGPARTDCRGKSQIPYQGPVPIIVHVHGAHSTPESDGYPEAWYLPDPAGSNFKCVDPAHPERANPWLHKYVCEGSLVNKYSPIAATNTPGVGHFTYRNDQPTATFWYHDHALGMTRNNVYAGPAGFWLLREADGGETGLITGTLPNPAPVAGEDLATTNLPATLGGSREKYREIPIVIQDRSFNADGSLFYPANRAFFEGLGNGQIPSSLGDLLAGLRINFAGGPIKKPSDIAPIWNPEAFFNVMVVNGVSWPNLDVEPDLYRFRLLDGCNSRFLNLSLQALNGSGMVLGEVPFYQIGAEQSLLPKVVQITTGYKTVLPGNGSIPIATPAAAPEEALLMGLAERADVLVDFSNLPLGTTHVRMINTGPDEPFGGFPVETVADPETTGQVMLFTLVSDTSAGEDFTAPENLVLRQPDQADDAHVVDAPGTEGTPDRDLALLEEESAYVCVNVRPNGNIVQDLYAVPDPTTPETCINKWTGALRNSMPFAPKAAVLGYNGADGGTVQLWSDDVQTNPAFNDTGPGNCGTGPWTGTPFTCTW